MQNINYDKVLKGGAITVTFGGVDYEVKEPTMGQLIDFKKESAKINDVDDVFEVAAQIKKIIHTIYADIPKETLDSYPHKALYAILDDVTAIVHEYMLPPGFSEGSTGNTPKKKLTFTK